MKVYVQLTGGLGNQLFQVSFGDFLKKKHGYELIYFKLCKSGDFKLDELKQLRPDIKVSNNLFFHLFYIFLNTPSLINLIPYFSYDRYVNKRKIKFYFGFWQFSDFYTYLDCDSIRSCLHNIFTKFIRKNDLRINNNVATMHIRGGDYLLQKHSMYHGVLDEIYYSNALKFIGQRTVYCITDDILHAKNIIDEIDFNKKDIILLTSIYKTSTLEDFSIMSNIKNGIIANSTFSWWAKVIANSDDVIAPIKWTSNASFVIKNKSWIYL